MERPALIIMAAGMGSRFGGLKQITPVGDRGEIIMDFSLYDAWKAGSHALLPMDDDQARVKALEIHAKVLSNRRPPYSVKGGLYDALCDAGGDIASVRRAILGRWGSENFTDVSMNLSFEVAALLLGALNAGIVAALADFLGALLFPVGPYFPGFTLTAFLMGLCYGLFLYKKQSFVRILAAVAVHQLVLSLLLNTLWISLLYGSPYKALLVSRLPQCALLTAVQLVVIQALVRLLPRLKRSLS